MIKYRLHQSSLITFQPNHYIDVINVKIRKDNGVLMPFTPLLCEFIYQGEYNAYTIKCRSLKAEKIMMDMYNDNHLIFNNKQSFRKAIKKIIEKYFAN